jgi:hypothetical protein
MPKDRKSLAKLGSHSMPKQQHIYTVTPEQFNSMTTRARFYRKKKKI